MNYKYDRFIQKPCIVETFHLQDPTTMHSSLLHSWCKQSITNSLHLPLKLSKKFPPSAKNSGETRLVKVLDAPNYSDDFYLNLLDWHKDFLAIALHNVVYLYNTKTSSVTPLISKENCTWTSLKFSPDGTYLAIADQNGQIDIIHIDSSQTFCRFPSQCRGRIPVMKWAHGNRLFAGQRDGSLVAYLDVLRSTHSARYISLHGQEICGIDLHYNSNLLATGANDNCVKLFDMRNSRSLYTLRHNAAVKGLCFDKHRSNKLYTGAGSKDQKIRAWNVSTGELCFSQETGSQICDLIQLCSSRTLVTSHGYASNDIKIWKIDRDCIHLSEVLAGHSERVLKMSLSQDETMIASVAGDEFLKFWKIRDKPIDSIRKENHSQCVAHPTLIR